MKDELIARFALVPGYPTKVTSVRLKTPNELQMFYPASYLGVYWVSREVISMVIESVSEEVTTCPS